MNAKIKMSEVYHFTRKNTCSYIYKDIVDVILVGEETNLLQRDKDIHPSQSCITAFSVSCKDGEKAEDHQCITCPANTFAVKGDTVCTKCGVNQISPEGSSRCFAGLTFIKEVFVVKNIRFSGCISVKFL